MLRALGLFFAANLLLGCTLKQADEPPCRGGTSRQYVVTQLTFTRENPKGVAPGFDLDHHVSSKPEDQSCGKVDLTSPDGTPGIDNQLALIVPEVEKQVGNAIDGIIQGAINDGRLLIVFQQEHVDEATIVEGADDSCVDMTVSLAQGKPSVGTDGVVEAYQTFDPKQDGQIISHGQGGRIDKGTFTIGPFPLRIPIAVFDVSFVVYVRDAVFRFTVDDQGNIQGLLGGGVSIDEIAEGVKNGAGVAPLVPQIKAIGNLFADLGYDTDAGTCSLVSAALAFKARPAFIRSKTATAAE